MKHRFLTSVAIALVVAAVAVPLALATAYDGYKSSYPQLHQLSAGTARGDVDLKSSYQQLHQLTSGAGVSGIDLKSSYPQLHQLTGSATTSYDDYKSSSYPQLHAVLSHQVAAPFVPTRRGFDWADAAIGAGTGAGAIFLIAAGALLFSRRHTRLAL